MGVVRGGGQGARPLSKHQQGRGAWAGTCPGTTRCPRRPPTPIPPTAVAGTRRSLTRGGVGAESESWEWKAAPPTLANGSALPAALPAAPTTTQSRPPLRGGAGARAPAGGTRGGRTPPGHPPPLSGSGGTSRPGEGGGGTGARRKGLGRRGRSVSLGGRRRAPLLERERGSGGAGNRIVQPVTFPPAAAPPALPPPAVPLARVQPTAPGGAGGPRLSQLESVSVSIPSARAGRGLPASRGGHPGSARRRLTPSPSRGRGRLIPEVRRKFLGTRRPPGLAVQIRPRAAGGRPGAGERSGGAWPARACAWGGPAHRADEGHCRSLASAGPRAGDEAGSTHLPPWVRGPELPQHRVWRAARPPPGPGAWGPAPVLVRRPRSVARRSLLGGSSSAALGLLLPPAPPPAAENRTFTWLPPPPLGARLTCPAVSPVLPLAFPPSLPSLPPPPATPQTPPPNP